MKKIIIKSIDIQDFKGIKNGSFNFHNGRNYINGKNGVGKSTLAEAIVFTLTGAGLFAESVHNEPVTKNGTIKENFNTKLELIISVDEILYTIKRSYVNQKGKTNTLTEMSINDKPFTKRRDFTEAIELILGLKEKEFQMFSNPKYLNALTNKAAREFVISLAESESDITIIDEHTKNLAESGAVDVTGLMNRIKLNITKDISLEDQLGMKEQEIKTSNGNLNKIDIMLTSKTETLNKISVLSDETKDVAALEKERKILVARIANVHEQNSKVLTFESHKTAVEYQIANSKTQIAQHETIIADLQARIVQQNECIAKCQVDFDTINAKPINEKCNICGSITDKTKELGEAAKQKALDEIESKVGDHKYSIKEFKKNLKLAKELLKEEKDSLERQQVELAQMTFKNETLDVTELQDRLIKINSTLGNDGSINIIKEEIKELQVRQNVAKAEADKLEFEKDNLDGIFEYKAHKIEDSINQKLDGVSVKLFEVRKNGNIKNIFTITHEGIDFDRMNQAMQIASGLKLLNYAQKSKGISVPIFVDNAESILQLPSTDSQTIEMYVKHCALEVK